MVPIAVRVPSAPSFFPSGGGGGNDAQEMLRAMPTAVENAADDARLGNPLERAQRLSTSWFGLIAELEGVVVDDTLDLHQRAWLEVAEELRLPTPLGQQLRRIKGVRDELVSRSGGKCARGKRRIGFVFPDAGRAETGVAALGAASRPRCVFSHPRKTTDKHANLKPHQQQTGRPAGLLLDAQPLGRPRDLRP